MSAAAYMTTRRRYCNRVEGWAGKGPWRRRWVGIVIDFIPVAGDIKGVVECTVDVSFSTCAGAVMGLLPVLGDGARILLRRGDAVVDLSRSGDGVIAEVATNRTGDAVADVADDVKLLPPATSVGSARRAEPGVASHGGSLPTIKDGDTWLRGTDGNAGRVPSQIAEQLSGKEFRNFDHFREEFWKAAANDPVLRRQFDTADQFRMQNGYAPRAPADQQVGGRVKYELDHNQELQNGGNVYDMNNIVIRTPLNHIRGK